jgi:16S rRNA (guanine966-N2)-methyltransferase
VRIVAGTPGGRVLRAPHGATTRPTSEKVREALFNLLGPLGDDDHALDLFAGAGGLGLEALSRGAASATFVERDRGALTALRGNVAALGVGDRATVIATDVVRFWPTRRRGRRGAGCSSTRPTPPGSTRRRWPRCPEPGSPPAA